MLTNLALNLCLVQIYSCKLFSDLQTHSMVCVAYMLMKWIKYKTNKVTKRIATFMAVSFLMVKDQQQARWGDIKAIMKAFGKLEGWSGL